MLSDRRLAGALVALPIVLLGGMLAWLAAEHGAAQLWSTAVHEDGRRTLADTVLYYRHFLREVPVTALYAAIAAGALLTYGPERRRTRSAARLAPWAGAAALVVVALAAVAATRQAGAATATWDLLQAYVRDDQWAYGSHWRAHILACCVYFCAAIVAASLVGRALDATYARPRPRARRRWMGGTLAALALLTLASAPSTDIIADPRVIGHQAREAVTHVLISLPLSLGVLIALTGTARTNPGSRFPPRDVVLAFVLGAVITLFLAIATLASGAVAAARPAAHASSLVAAHFFEHSLDYVWLALVSAWLAGRAACDGGD